MKKRNLALLLAMVLLILPILVSCAAQAEENPTADTPQDSGQDENEKTSVKPIEGEKDAYYKNPKGLYEQLADEEIPFAAERKRTPPRSDVRTDEGEIIVSAEAFRSHIETLLCDSQQMENGYNHFGAPGALTAEGQEVLDEWLKSETYAGYDSSFFAEKVVIPVYCKFGSGLRTRIERIVKQGDELVVVLQEGTRYSENGFDIATVLTNHCLVEIDKKDVEGIQKAKVFSVPLNDARMPQDENDA